MIYDGHEVLIPVHSNIVLSLDRNSKVVKTNLPDGLLDVYCKPEAQEEI
jgi:hypothetical protein